MNDRCEHCIVRQFNAMRAMTKAELKKVSDAKELKQIQKGKPLFTEGERLGGVYCIRSGVSKLSKLSLNGKDQIVKIASKGEVLGQRSLLNKEPSSLSAVALKDVEVCFIPMEAIDGVLANNPDFSVELLRHMAHELNEADDVILNMSQYTVKQRLARILLFLDQYGKDQEGYFSLQLSRDDIASMAGTATESAIRLLSSFKKEGLIKTRGRKIGILDSKGLHRALSL
jgi:CRP-like cAMP-binding protein